MRFKLLLVSGLIVSMLLPIGIAAAQSNDSDAASRLSSVAQAQNVSLDNDAKLKVIGSCKNAQDALKTVKERNEKQAKLRLDTYQDVWYKGLALQIRLKRQSIDVSPITQTLRQLQNRIEEFKNLENSYQQTLNDTVAIDCQQNPEYFKAGLELSRQNQELLLSKTDEIKVFVLKDIDSKFSDVRGKLSI